MTTLPEASVPPDAERDVPVDGTDRRLGGAMALARRLPLIVHVLALAAVLVGVLLIVDTGALANADEGAVMVQARILNEHGEWGVRSPIEAIDPEGRWFPIDLTDRQGDRWYPYTKHTIYPQLVAAIEDWRGWRAVLGLHVAAVVATAWAAALLARRVAPGWERLTLWTVGVASPILFDGYWVIAHALATVGSVLAVLGALVALGIRSDGPDGAEPATGRRLAGWALMSGALTWSVLLRSEATLFGLALAGALGVVWLVRRVRGAFSTAVLAGGVTIAGYLGSAELEQIAMGSGSSTPFHIKDQQTSFLEGRVTGFWHSVLSPQLAGVPTGAIIAFLAAALVAVAWAYLRFRPSEISIIRGAAIGGAVLWVARVVVPAMPVPGLLIACPLLVAGALSARRALLDDPRRIVIVTAGLYALAVLATQYGSGGSGDWGGRYLHLAVPVVIPLCLVAVGAAVDRVGVDLRRVMVATLIVSSLAISLLAVRTLYRMHDLTGRVVESVHDVAMSTSEAMNEGGPVVVTSEAAFGRFSWRHVLDSRYLTVTERDELPEVSAALSGADVEDFVFAASDADVRKAVPLLAREGYELDHVVELDSIGWQVAVFNRS